MMRRVAPFKHILSELRINLNAIGRICCVIGLIVVLWQQINGSPAASAEHTDVYLVTDVLVDITAATAADARQKAIELGHRKASDRLIKRLVPVGERNSVPEIDQSELNLLIQSYSVDEERRSAIRYIGTLRFQFRRSEVRRFLRVLGVGFAETMSKPLLIIPVFASSGVTLLWDNPNPWLAAWRGIPVSDGLVPMRLPIGSLLDIRDLSARQAVSGDLNQLKLVANRYSSEKVIVVNASLNIDFSTGTRSISTSLRYFGDLYPQAPSEFIFALRDNETIEDATRRVAQSLAEIIEEKWKRENLIRFNKLSELKTKVSFNTLPDWVNIRARLRRIALLNAAQIISISRRHIFLNIVFYGDAHQLCVALAQQDLSLRKEKNRWLLRDLRKNKVSKR